MSKQNIGVEGWFTIAFFTLMLGILIKGTYDSLRSQRAHDEGKLDSHQVKYLEFDGHQYVKYTDGYRGGLCHSPKCPCNTLKDNQLQQ